MKDQAQDNLIRWRKDPSLFVREVFDVVPDAWQDKVLKLFPTNARVALKASKGVGKLMPKSLIIPTPDGFRKWGDLQVGDKVFAEDGSVTTIINTYDNGFKDIYKVTFDDGSSTLVGGEHLWKVKGQRERARQGGGSWIVISTDEIIKRGVRVSNGKWQQRQFEIPIHGAAQFPEKDLPIDPYLLGIWLGDGSRGAPSYCKPYKEIEIEINKRGYSTNRAKDGKQVHISNSLRKFEQLECFYTYSHTRFVPDIYKFGSVEQRKDLICGLLDSDGCVGKENNHVEYATTSKQLAEDVVWLVRSLGGKAFIKDAIKKPFYYDDEDNKITGKDCYRVSVRLPFNPFKLPHKAERWKPAYSPEQLRYFKRYIDNIELVSNEDSMCIEVAHPSHCYLANDFIVTHNTALLAWIAWNFLLTREHPLIAATSISADSLADNLWTEMARWLNKSPMLQKTFTWQKTKIFANDAPETWYMTARSYAKTSDPNRQGDALAGLHAKNILFLLDESGGMHESILASAEAALSTCEEGHIVQAGNPTHLEGALYRACSTNRKLWEVVEISSDPDDPNRSNLVSKEWARQQIELYGKDNPYVLVNVFGQFPPASLNALIGYEEVQEAMNRDYKPGSFSGHAKILGVDVARFGDDSSIIFPRQGLQAFIPFQYRNLDGTQGAAQVARKWQDWEADAVFIDDTGGFGASWIDNLKRLGFAPIGVHFAEKATNPKFANKRSEMMFNCVEWIKSGGALPKIPELTAALTQTTYSFNNQGAMLIEPKEIIKQKLGYSPDHLDALMLSFYAPVAKNDGLKPSIFKNNRHTVNYDPLDLNYIKQDIGSGGNKNHTYEYDSLKY